jgi:ribosomal protein L35AE/L33A
MTLWLRATNCAWSGFGGMVERTHGRSGVLVAQSHKEVSR